jgi:hypothetical protein
MRAKVKSTGEIVEVAYRSEDKYGNKYYNVTTDTRTYRETELEMMSDKGDNDYTYDYWTRLEHTYAGMAMQGLVTRGEVLGTTKQEIAIEIADISDIIAHALIQKLKEKEERK